METPYIPYSKRHNITDKDLAGLLDYLERVMGWDITLQFNLNDNGKVRSTEIFEELKEDRYIEIIYGRTSFGSAESISTEIFYRSYKTLLPVIRDLSCRKG